MIRNRDYQGPDPALVVISATSPHVAMVNSLSYDVITRGFHNFIAYVSFESI